MTEHFENPAEIKLEKEVPSVTPEQKVQHIADEAAGKAAKAEQKSDADRTIFTK